MGLFETGIASYITAKATVKVAFPIDLKGVAHVNCANCYYFSKNTSRCRLNGEVCAFPDRYVGSHCPLDIIEKGE